MEDKTKSNNSNNAIPDLILEVLNNKKPAPTAAALSASPGESDAGEADIPPNSIQFRLPQRRERFSAKHLWVAVMLAIFVPVIAISLSIIYVPDFREQSLLTLEKWAKGVKGQKVAVIARPVLAQASRLIKTFHPRPVEFSAAPIGIPVGSCSTFIATALNKRVKSSLTDKEFQFLIECELFQDSINFVSQSLEKKGGAILDTPPTWDDIELKLLALETQRRMTPYSPIPNISKQGCLRWSAAPECLLRYIDESRSTYKSRWQDGFSALEKLVVGKSKNIQAWFYLASANYAIKERSHAKAHDLLQKSFDLAGVSHPYVEREIFRSALLNAYYSKDPGLLKKAKLMRPTKRAEEDPRAFFDSDLLEIIGTKEERKALDEFFSQSDAVQRFSGDPRFLQILLSQSQLFDLQTVALNTADQVFGTRDSIVAENIGEPMVLLYARMLIGANKEFEALEILTALEKSGYVSAELYHLKGLSQLSYKKPEYKMMAAKEFQTAVGMNKSDDSMFTVVIALLEAKSIAKADLVMKQWKTLGAHSQKSLWFGLAEGLIRHYDGKKDQALTIWATTEAAYPNYPIWVKLKTNLNSDAEYLDGDLGERLRLILPSDSPLGSLAIYGQKS